MNTLEQLKQFTQVVADTGDFELIKKYQPKDATTNPSLILKAASNPKYSHFLQSAIDYARALGLKNEALIEEACDKVAVGFGIEILKNVQGMVSTEVDATLSFNTQAIIKKARKLIFMYEEAGASREKVLIKIAATWEGIKAARALETENIRCNLTLLFSFVQAVATAQAGVFLVSPFVGRIMDFYKAKEGRDFEPHEDPGVLSVRKIYNYYKKNNYKTIVMGASFRNTGEILALAGVDKLTISPALLEELQNSMAQVSQKLSLKDAFKNGVCDIEMNESTFRFMMNEDEMAIVKLSEGIRAFAADLNKLKTQMKQLL